MGFAGGGLVSSQQDLAVFLGGMADGTLLSAASLDEMLDDVPIGYPDYSYGLGLFLIDFGAHKKVWGHEGHGGAFAYWWPDQSEAIVGTVNQTEVLSLDAKLLGIEELEDAYMASVEFSGMIREDQSAGPSPFREVWNMTKPRHTAGGWLVAGVQALQ